MVSEPDVGAQVTLVAGVTVSTQKRISISTASTNQHLVLVNKTLDALRVSYQGLASRSEPFTIDEIGVMRSECAAGPTS